jgi:hypothetical protein
VQNVTYKLRVKGDGTVRQECQPGSKDLKIGSTGSMKFGHLRLLLWIRGLLSGIRKGLQQMGLQSMRRLYRVLAESESGLA